MTFGDPACDALFMVDVALMALELEDFALGKEIFQAYHARVRGRIIHLAELGAFHVAYEI